MIFHASVALKVTDGARGGVWLDEAARTTIMPTGTMVEARERAEVDLIEARVDQMLDELRAQLHARCREWRDGMANVRASVESEGGDGEG